MKKLLKPHYSGKLSKKFWKKINSIKGKKGDIYYTAGVLLQDIEGAVLRGINGD